jgi:tetratricopeptide (TPR) repeat protein
LAEGQYDVAFDVLEGALRRAPGRHALGATWLQLAAIYALYGEDGLENGPPALRNAVTADPNLAAHPLYRALYWEFAAYRGATVAEVKRGLRGPGPKPRPAGGATEDELTAVAGYHAAAALFYVDAARSAAATLGKINDGALPTYLEWRRWSLLGQCAELMGDWDGAASAFKRAVAQAPRQEQGAERLSLAGALVELMRTDEAQAELEQVDDAALSLEERAVHRYLLGRSHLELDNPNRALELLKEAAELDDQEGGASYSVTFATAQALAALGRTPEAAAAFQQALQLAPAEHRAFTQHEAAFALIEAGQLADAEGLLGEVVTDPSYSHRGEALADLADLNLRRGELDAAAELAQQALELGATASACITLGSVAFEYFRLDEATSWYEQAVSASLVGDPFWVAAQQMLADVYAQMGDAYAPHLLQHAKAALDYTENASEWYIPLRQYVDAARRRLGGFERVLN